jgi:hypothetical protein
MMGLLLFPILFRPCQTLVRVTLTRLLRDHHPPGMGREKSHVSLQSRISKNHLKRSEVVRL